MLIMLLLLKRRDSTCHDDDVSDDKVLPRCPPVNLNLQTVYNVSWLRSWPTKVELSQTIIFQTINLAIIFSISRLI